MTITANAAESKSDNGVQNKLSMDIQQSISGSAARHSLLPKHNQIATSHRIVDVPAAFTKDDENDTLKYEIKDP